MKKNGLLGLGAVAAASMVMLTGFRAEAGPGFRHGGEPGPFHGQKIERMLDEVNATPAQRQQIEAILERLRSERPDRREFAERHQEMVEFWQNPNPDAAAMKRQIDQRIDEQRANAYRHVDAMVEIHRILTPEQRTRVAQLMEQKAQKRHEKLEKHHEKKSPKSK